MKKIISFFLIFLIFLILSIEKIQAIINFEMIYYGVMEGEEADFFYEGVSNVGVIVKDKNKKEGVLEKIKSTILKYKTITGLEFNLEELDAIPAKLNCFACSGSVFDILIYVDEIQNLDNLNSDYYRAYTKAFPESASGFFEEKADLYITNVHPCFVGHITNFNSEKSNVKFLLVMSSSKKYEKYLNSCIEEELGHAISFSLDSDSYFLQPTIFNSGSKYAELDSLTKLDELLMHSIYHAGIKQQDSKISIRWKVYKKILFG